jgi:muramoyltetrapeptide carboxypeptidase
MTQSALITPLPLQPGDTVAIISPASIVDPLRIQGACRALEQWGFTPRVMPHAAGHRGTYAGSMEERLADLRQALDDHSVRAILCSRGGYGAVHLLGHVEPQRPVWLIGFSDISALHALWHHCGFRSIHGSMAKHLAEFPLDDLPNRSLHAILTTGQQPTYSFAAHKLNRCGSVTGELVGGNFAVLADLIGTPYDLLLADKVLFIEDISEPIYKVERILHQLRLSGTLGRLRGLIVGQFTDYHPNANHFDMEAMIADITAPYAYPIAFNAPIGHVDGNLPIIEGSTITFTVAPGTVTLHG